MNASYSIVQAFYSFFFISMPLISSEWCVALHRLNFQMAHVIQKRVYSLMPKNDCVPPFVHVRCGSFLPLSPKGNVVLQYPSEPSAEPDIPIFRMPWECQTRKEIEDYSSRVLFLFTAWKSHMSDVVETFGVTCSCYVWVIIHMVQAQNSSSAKVFKMVLHYIRSILRCIPFSFHFISAQA